MRKFLIIPFLITVALFIGACDSSSQSSNTDTTPTQARGAPAHQSSPELEQKVLADATEDLRIIAATGQDASGLSQALTGKALEETRAAINQDLADGKYRKRDYQNIKVRLQDFTAPIAQVFAEFDDNGFYVDASSGAALTQPTQEHKTYALAMVEEDGRWKITGIYASAGTTTATTTTPTQ